VDKDDWMSHVRMGSHGQIWPVLCEASQLVFLLPGHRWERGGGLLPPPPLRREGIATESIGEEEAPL
jgi:hypothetical protein